MEIKFGLNYEFWPKENCLDFGFGPLALNIVEITWASVTLTLQTVTELYVCIEKVSKKT